MNTRSKVVDLVGLKFEVRKLLPDAGSFIFMRMLGISMRMATAVTSGAQTPAPAPTPEEAKELLAKTTGEMRVRALAFSVFSGGISFEDFRFIQEHCMQVVSIIKEREGVDFPLPIMTLDGTWTPDGAAVRENVSLVMQLTTEVLVLCFSDFFAESSPGL